MLDEQTRDTKGAVTLCNFLSNLSRNGVAKQVVEKIMALLHCAIFPATCNTFGRGKLGARFKMAK